MANEIKRGAATAERFGRAVRRARLAQGITLTELAGNAAVTRVYISSIENGRACPTLDVVIRIAGALHLATWRLVREACNGE